MSRKTKNRRLRKRGMLVDCHNLVAFLESKGIDIPDPNDKNYVLLAARAYFQTEYGFNVRRYAPHNAFRHLMQSIPKGELRTLMAPSIQPPKHESTTQALITAFYASYEWRKLRYTVLKKHGFKCLACGRSATDGAVIHVDHKKPLRYNWQLRLDEDNLQPLCDWCNHGKGNWDETDFTIRG